MKISRYGITLELLTAQHTEMVRHWRNDKKIAKHMFYKGEITTAMQQEWFTSVNNEQNYFFLIQYNGNYVGLINMSSIDWESQTAYSGLFIYDDAYLGTDIPVSASLAMLDVFFLLLNIQTVFAKVKGDNAVAHQYNTMLGFSQTKKIELGLGHEYLLNKEVYLLKAKKLRNAAIRLKGNQTKIEIMQEGSRDKFINNKLQRMRTETFATLGVELLPQTR
ncbi:MAG: GNAT family N-acetyltransferase [Chitinophagales bacterium]|nr:GNAT family N-acetyltransferase [Chitinophagales bacterium]